MGNCFSCMPRQNIKESQVENRKSVNLSYLNFDENKLESSKQVTYEEHTSEICDLVYPSDFYSDKQLYDLQMKFDYPFSEYANVSSKSSSGLSLNSVVTGKPPCWDGPFAYETYDSLMPELDNNLAGQKPSLLDQLRDDPKDFEDSCDCIMGPVNIENSLDSAMQSNIKGITLEEPLEWQIPIHKFLSVGNKGVTFGNLGCQVTIGSEFTFSLLGMELISSINCNETDKFGWFQK